MGLNVRVAVVAGLTALTMTCQWAQATDSLLDGHEALIASNAGIAAPTGTLTLSTTATQETEAATTQAEEDMDIFPAAAAPLRVLSRLHLHLIARRRLVRQPQRPRVRRNRAAGYPRAVPAACV